MDKTGPYGFRDRQLTDHEGLPVPVGLFRRTHTGPSCAQEVAELVWFEARAIESVDSTANFDLGGHGEIRVCGQVDPSGRPRLLLVGGYQKSRRVDVRSWPAVI
ncbi:hypothetical protein KDK95_00230 [Actinospica sp. MGRD01-02]|uniref:Uncharacterized protein n=1 Tax=Actinospica acidithermotolerans TaxID=2828514 RepID=A0A941E5D6_9ACTN|nr:hypothetical protein [Actinospica acidithermotolerans]MBR7824717.1 hypothetical protein [Actinospica acidithermotolerans]